MSVLEYWFIKRDIDEQITNITKNPDERRYYESKQEEAEQEIERMLRT